jgi:hypothetical protein
MRWTNAAPASMPDVSVVFLRIGGERGIRTPGTLPGSVVFKTTAIDHSAISPYLYFIREFTRLSSTASFSRIKVDTMHSADRTVGFWAVFH